MGRTPLPDPPADVSDSEDEYEVDDEPKGRGWLVFLGIALAAYIYSLDGELEDPQVADSRHDDVPVSLVCVSCWNPSGDGDDLPPTHPLG
jgi:hypothetical protein